MIKNRILAVFGPIFGLFLAHFTVFLVILADILAILVDFAVILGSKVLPQSNIFWFCQVNASVVTFYGGLHFVIRVRIRDN